MHGPGKQLQRAMIVDEHGGPYFRSDDQSLILSDDQNGESIDSVRKAKTGTNVGRQLAKATILNVLIASPSDAIAERDAVESAIQEWNANHHADTGVMLHAVRWESHSYPASGDRPQAIVNRQIVDQGDFLIGIFGNRLGTPTGAAQSGTIEEIERFRKAGKHVVLYFSTADLPRNADREQLKALEDYQRERQKDTLYATFRTGE
jgi:hypothetical protein